MTHAKSSCNLSLSLFISVLLNPVPSGTCDAVVQADYLALTGGECDGCVVVYEDWWWYDCYFWQILCFLCLLHRILSIFPKYCFLSFNLFTFTFTFCCSSFVIDFFAFEPYCQFLLLNSLSTACIPKFQLFCASFCFR